jgi:hypothetical protein
LPWNSLTYRVLRWPLFSVLYIHVNPFHMNDRQGSRFLLAYLVIVFCKAVLVLFPIVLLIRKPLDRHWHEIAVWIACLGPFLLGLQVGLGLMQIEHRWNLSGIVVLTAGTAISYLLRTIAKLPFSRTKRIWYSLPCWAFWLLWSRIVVREWSSDIVTLAALFIYSLALREPEDTTSAVSRESSAGQLLS